MPTLRHPARAAALLLSGVLMMAAAAASVSSSLAASPPAFALSADRATAQLAAGAQDAVRVDVAGRKGWHGNVTLSVSGVPSHTKIVITPRRVPTGRSAGIAIVPTGTVATGNYTLHITGQAGSTTHQLTVSLATTGTTAATWTISPALGRVVESFGIAYRIAVNRGSITGPIHLGLSNLPAGTTATVREPTLIGGTTTVLVQLGNNVVPGTYRMYLHGTAPGVSVSLPVHLVVVRHHFRNFPIEGNLDRLLAPGITGVLDLNLSDLFTHSMKVTGITVRIVKTNRAACSASNFTVSQYIGPTTLIVPGHSTRTLSQLGVPTSDMPTVTMLDLPVNQDACKNAVVSLAYSGAGVDL